MSNPPLDRYRPWFHAAALYNLLWGALNVLAPQMYFRWLGLPLPKELPYWQVVGMLVMVYAPAYWWAGRRPDRHAHIILIGLLGKVLGPVGFVFSVIAGQLPLAFGWINLTNDVIWWPSFVLYLRDAARLHGGWRKFLVGE